MVDINEKNIYYVLFKIILVKIQLRKTIITDIGIKCKYKLYRSDA